MYEGSLFFTSFPKCIICRPFDDSRSDTCELIPHYGFEARGHRKIGHSGHTAQVRYPVRKVAFQVSDYYGTSFLLAQTTKNLPAMQENWVRSLGWEAPLKKGMATHSSILAWKIPWTEEPDGLQSPGLQRVRHN